MAIIWSGFVLSAFVYGRLPETVHLQLIAGLVTFLGVPLLSLLGFIVLRLVRRKVGAPPSRGEDLVVAWVMTFLLGIHCLVVGLSLGIIDSLERGLPLATGLLFVGLGPVLGTLEHGSAMGIRTRATLASREAWVKTHRLLGVLFPIAGVAGFCGWWLSGFTALAVSVLPGVSALAVVIAYAATQRAEPDPPGEDEGEADRPKEDGDVRSP